MSYCLCFQVTRRQGFYPMECRRQSKVIQALFCFRIYQSLCHVSSESLGWCHGSPNYPLKGVPYRFPPHDFPGIASFPEDFFGSNNCGSGIGPPIKSQSHIITFTGKKDSGWYLPWARSYPSKRSGNATSKNSLTKKKRCYMAGCLTHSGNQWNISLPPKSKEKSVEHSNFRKTVGICPTVPLF